MSEQYKGGCIFTDHMSGYVHVEHQLGLSSSESIQAKQRFKSMSLHHGIVIEKYLTDNRVFNGKDFMREKSL